MTAPSIAPGLGTSLPSGIATGTTGRHLAMLAKLAA
jgi:hypothetical protein